MSLAAPTFSGLPPAVVHVAEGDPLRDEGVAYAEALVRGGGACKLTVHAGLIHHFYGLDAVILAARPALDEIVAELAEAFRV